MRDHSFNMHVHIVNATITSLKSIGLSYIVMSALLLITTYYGLFGDYQPGRTVSIPSVIFTIWLIFTLVFYMWRRSAYSGRNVIVGLMVLETVISAVVSVYGAAYPMGLTTLVTIFWLIGIYKLYTGPSFRQIAQLYRHRR